MEDEIIIPDSLVNALKSHQVIPFVGAGVSRAVEKKDKDSSKSFSPLFPSWSEYVEILADALTKEGKLGDGDLVRAYVKTSKPKYLEAMQHAFEELGAPLWYQKLNEYFRKDESESDPASLELAKLVWQLGSNVIFTSNIDRVLEWKSVKNEHIEVLDTQKVEQAELLQNSDPSPTVLYLHGRVGDKENIVFTRDQYDDFYKHKKNEAKLRSLQSYLTTKSFLFTGFSLDDAMFVEQLNYIHEIYKGGIKQYFALVRKSEAGKLNHLKFVTEVYFEDFGDPLIRVLRKMSGLANESSIGDLLLPTRSSTASSFKTGVDTTFFNVPYNSKATEFVGRHGLQDEIWKLLVQNGCASIGQAVNVEGFGGLGKTQLAVEYAHTFQKNYKNGVFWLVADENIDNQLLKIADKLGWIFQSEKQVNQIDVAKANFLKLSECLIILDNVESYTAIKDYLPKTDIKTHILITSKQKIPEFRSINLELLKRDESRDLLLKVSKRNLESESEKLSFENVLEMLSDIPLAIELVGGYLAEHTNVSFADYQQFLTDISLDELESAFPNSSFTNHDRSIIRTLRISENLIEEKPLMVEILNVLAWSASSSMSISLLDSLVESENAFQLKTALGDAINLRLLKKDEASDRYAIHRLLAKVIRHENPINKNKSWHQRIVVKLESWFESKIYDFNDLYQFESEIAHLNNWQHLTVLHLPSNAVLLTALLGSPPHYRGDFKKTQSFLNTAIEIYNDEKLSDELLIATLLNFLSVNENHLGNYKKAFECNIKSLEIRQRLLGDQSSHTARTIGNLGATYSAMGEYDKALEYDFIALEMRQKIYGEDHIDIAFSLNNIGTTYSNLNQNRESLNYHLRALKMRRKLYGSKHPEIASSLHNMASCFHELKFYEKALKYNKRALKMRVELYGEEHPEIARGLNNLASNHFKLKNKAVALELQTQAFQMYVKLLGVTHPDTIHCAVSQVIAHELKYGRENAGKLAAEFLKYTPHSHPDRQFFEERGSIFLKGRKKKRTKK